MKVSLNIIILFLLPIGFYMIYSYNHFQIASSIDCSLAINNTDLRHACFKAAEIKTWEFCYNVQCGSDINHTINYENKPIQISLAEPLKEHRYD